MKVLELEMKYPLGACVQGVTKYRWHRLPNNWLAIQEICIREDLNFSNETHMFPVHNLQDKSHSVEISNASIQHMFHLFKEDRFCLIGDDPVYYLMAQELSLEAALLAGRMAWNALLAGDLYKELVRIAEENFAGKERALEQIENVVCSVMNRDARTLTKADFSYIFVGPAGRWKSFYPSLEELIEFHKKSDTFNCDYVDFLKSERLKRRRSIWESEEGVVIKE